MIESDLALLERFLRGDEEAFTEIVERYQKKVYFFDEEGAARVFPILSRYDKKRMDLEVERFRIMRELRETINDDRAR